MLSYSLNTPHTPHKLFIGDVGVKHIDNIPAKTDRFQHEGEDDPDFMAKHDRLIPILNITTLGAMTVPRQTI